MNQLGCKKISPAALEVIRRPLVPKDVFMQIFNQSVEEHLKLSEAKF